MTRTNDVMGDLRSQLAQALAPAYVVGQEIGAGGMARVYAATATVTGKRVAVKVLAPAITACCDADRFRREMAVVAQLDHPHIVPLLHECDVCGNGRLFYYVMPFVDGETLSERLQREGRLAVDDAVRLLRDIANALAYAHDKGVVHRDIKPANILLSADRAIVADFGIAKAVDAASRGTQRNDRACDVSDVAARSADVDMTRVGVVVGTPAYMAPEQAAGDDVDHRSDLYALGVVAYEMLVGAAPFAGDTPQSMMVAHLTQPAPSVLARRRGVPAALADIVARLLEKSPDDRPQSAESVLHALSTIAGLERNEPDAAVALRGS